MREIRFRFWDKKESRYLTKKDCPMAFYSFTELSVGDTYIAEQYTGFKDSEGKDIYEGDIIKTIKKINGNFVDNIISEGEVVFMQGNFKFQYKDKERLFACDLHVALDARDTIKVIGNIHKVTNDNP